MGLQQVTADVLAGTVFQGYMGGLTLSNSPTAGTASGTMAISVGVAADSTNVTVMTIGAFTKTVAAWASGTGNGGLDSGSTLTSGSWYHFYLIGGPTVATDVLFSLNPVAGGTGTPTLPTNYTISRRIGSAKAASTTTFTGFIQHGETFLWSSPTLDINNVVGSATAALTTMSIPTGIIVEGLFVGNNTSDNQQAYISDPAVTDQAATATAAPLSTFGGLNNNAGNMAQNTPFRCFVNTSAQVRVRNNAGGSNNYVATIGWVDTRGRFA